MSEATPHNLHAFVVQPCHDGFVCKLLLCFKEDGKGDVQKEENHQEPTERLAKNPSRRHEDDDHDNCDEHQHNTGKENGGWVAAGSHKWLAPSELR
mmetsp:Transcript_46411/g.68556  ORF Transcript_46411/g.68556 Transcript_46411/m.68556 type:complete len:96 (+) Transcript_46411:103-390(+)